MDTKTKEKVNEIVVKYRVVEKQFSKKFEKIPQRWYWTYGLVMGILFTLVYFTGSPLYNTSFDAGQIALFGIITSMFTLLFTGLALVVVIPLVLLIVLAPMIRNKIKEAKTIFVDYPKVMREGSFNEKSAEIVKAYLRIVFKEELELIRETLKKEVQEEIKNNMSVANTSYQKHEEEIIDLKSQIVNLKSIIEIMSLDKKETTQLTSEKMHVKNQTDEDIKP